MENLLIVMFYFSSKTDFFHFFFQNVTECGVLALFTFYCLTQSYPLTFTLADCPDICEHIFYRVYEELLPGQTEKRKRMDEEQLNEPRSTGVQRSRRSQLATKRRKTTNPWI